MKKSEKIELPKEKPRYSRDPHGRSRIIPSRKGYDRKKVRGPDDRQVEDSSRYPLKTIIPAHTVPELA